MSTHPAEREAERLRTIIETMILTQPHVTMQDAGPMIFEIEKKTAQMEAQQVAPPPVSFPVPNFEKETLKAFIDLVPMIQDYILGSKKINAIKEVRALTGAGLKESKEGVEFWEAEEGHKARLRLKPMPRALDPETIARWISTDSPETMDFIDAGQKILAIKEVRAQYPSGAGLKEAKEGVEYYVDHYL